MLAHIKSYIALIHKKKRTHKWDFLLQLLCSEIGGFHPTMGHCSYVRYSKFFRFLEMVYSSGMWGGENERMKSVYGKIAVVIIM